MVQRVFKSPVCATSLGRELESACVLQRATSRKLACLRWFHTGKVCGVPHVLTDHSDPVLRCFTAPRVRDWCTRKRLMTAPQDHALGKRRRARLPCAVAEHAVVHIAVLPRAHRTAPGSGTSLAGGTHGTRRASAAATLLSAARAPASRAPALTPRPTWTTPLRACGRRARLVVLRKVLASEARHANCADWLAASMRRSSDLGPPMWSQM